MKLLRAVPTNMTATAPLKKPQLDLPSTVLIGYTRHSGEPSSADKTNVSIWIFLVWHGGSLRSRFTPMLW